MRQPDKHDELNFLTEALLKRGYTVSQIIHSLDIHTLDESKDFESELKDDGFLKAVVVPDESAGWHSLEEADIVVTVSGKVIKNRYGKTTLIIPPTSAPPSADLDYDHESLRHESVSTPIITPEPKLEEPKRGVPLIEQALQKLSGDLSHDNIAAAKNILKKIIG